MICSALDVATGSPVEITFDKTITEVTAAKEEPELYIAPGFIDLQVNGFAGVDYNSPETPLEEIARSVRVIQAAGGAIRLITLSPHWPEAPRYIEAIVADGVTVSIGHTGADACQIAEAVSAGATMSTHLGNGAHQVLKRHPNYLWDQMAEDRLTAGVIVDGSHIGAALRKLASG